jgi:hypothetical protein
VAFNTYILATYQTATVAGVTVCDIGNNTAIFNGTNDPTVYLSDGIHFTNLGHSLIADYVNTVLSAAYPSLLTSRSQVANGNLQIPWEWINPPQAMTLDTSALGQRAPLRVIGSNSQSQIILGGTTIQDGTGGLLLSNAGKNVVITNPANVNSADVPVTIRQAGATTVSGSTSGTAQFNQVSTISGRKEVLVYCNALLGTATFPFPTAFTNTPVVVTTSGPAASVVTTLSTLTMTVTGATTTGYIDIIGN